MKLKGFLVPVRAVTGRQRAAMLALMEQHYENVHPAVFAADLDEKQWVILLLEPRTEALAGFSTQMLLDVDVAGQPVQAPFSGDRLALSLMDAYPFAELYWFLISKGYRTYRFLPLFFHEFYPRYDVPTTPWAKAVLDALGRHKYPAAYDPAGTLVRAGAGKDWLRRGLAEITAERLRDPHVRFFAERNPGHTRGDELCCIAPLTRENFTPAAYRVIGPEPVLPEVLG